VSRHRVDACYSPVSRHRVDACYSPVSRRRVHAERAPLRHYAPPRFDRTALLATAPPPCQSLRATRHLAMAAHPAAPCHSATPAPHHNLLCRSPSLETHSPRNRHQPGAFSLIMNRSCKPLSGRYYREHSDGVDRRFSRGRQGPRTPGDFDCFIPRCPRGFQTTKNCRSSWFRRSPGQPAATCASPEPDCWCRLLRPPLATASTSQTGSIGRRHNSRPQR
jgi:hypothetical protein